MGQHAVFPISHQLKTILTNQIAKWKEPLHRNTCKIIAMHLFFVPVFQGSWVVRLWLCWWHPKAKLWVRSWRSGFTCFKKKCCNKYLLKVDSILSRIFSIEHVVVVESPKQEEKDIKVKLFASLPDGSDIRKDNQSVILGATLQEILVDDRNKITSVFLAEIKSISMDSDSESKENNTDHKMNYIMIPQ